MSFELLIDEHGCRNAVVIRKDGNLLDYFVDPSKEKLDFYPPKTFMWAVIERRIKRNGGYFIKLPNGNTGFLVTKDDYINGTPIEVMSQVFYESGKPQKFTDKLKIVTEFFIVEEGSSNILLSKKLSKNQDLKQFKQFLNNKKVNVLLRSNLAKLDLSLAIKKFKNAINDYYSMVETLKNKNIFYWGLAKKVALDKYCSENYNITEKKGIFDSLGIWDQLIEASKEHVPFGRGSYIFLEQTKSFCAVDVNSGSDFHSSKQEINMKACEKIYSIIKQRGLGGKIFIDFLPSSQKLRKGVAAKMETFFASDSQKYTLWGWTKGGTFEIERERDKTPLGMLIDW